MRTSGVLLPISSLPSKYGIGCFSKDAYQFVDSLVKAGQHYWQILPLGPTSYGDSPYASFSTFAGNPYFISLEALIKEGLLDQESCDEVFWGGSESFVDYDKQYEFRFPLLRKAFSHFKGEKGYDKFLKLNSFWLEDYALYMAVKAYFKNVSWNEWDEDIRLRDPKAISNYSELLKEDMDFYKFLQFKFYQQWDKLKKYANKKGIEIIGDLPIYVAFDSADTWSHPELFQLDKENVPTGVAGCPPDAFSETGQLWGNPLYRWDYHKETGYAWWMARMKRSFENYDVVRIDHFRGFEAYFNIPYGDKTAVNGHWELGPGYDLFKTMEEKLGKQRIIAEDLGLITDEVRALLKECGYPNMKVIQFAFDPFNYKNEYLPGNYPTSNCVVYTGTHDNDTLLSWVRTLSEDQKKMVQNYLFYPVKSEEKMVDGLIYMAQMSCADTCIVPIQDYLGVGNEGRINFPSTLGTNWKWRMTKGQVSPKVIRKMKNLAVISGRCEG
ncbi:MAG: 4-alpha-glucanotransferase [Erysipelotrichaceae bacterium]|nr:4-alpha-glucanotransferase [Erysipelotrichaceae bacterium]